MEAICKAKFDGRAFTPETPPQLTPGQIYLPQIQAVDTESEQEKIDGLRQAVKDPAFMRDLQQTMQDFRGVDSDF